MASNHLESLRRGNSAKPFQSKLTPHLEYIRERRSARIPYSQIANELASRFGLRVAASSIHAFVKARSTRRDVYTIADSQPHLRGKELTAESKDPIEQLKSKPISTTTQSSAWSFYDATKPLEKLCQHENQT